MRYNFNILRAKYVSMFSIFLTQILTTISTLLLVVEIKLLDNLYIWYTLNYADQYWFIYSTKNTLYLNTQ